jgi:hypothetical protein
MRRFVSWIALAGVLAAPPLSAQVLKPPKVKVEAAKVEAFLQSLGYQCQTDAVANWVKSCTNPKAPEPRYTLDFRRNDAGHLTLLGTTPPRNAKVARAEVVRTLGELSQLPYETQDRPRVTAWFSKVSAPKAIDKIPPTDFDVEIGGVCFSYVLIPDAPMLVIQTAGCPKL